MKNFVSIFCIIFIFAFWGCSENKVEQIVFTGLDIISESESIFTGQKIGIVTNHTAYNFKDQHILDVFREMQNVEVVALFGPEHGIKGDEAAGEKIKDGFLGNIPVYSLYGKTRKPTPEMLEDCDLLVYDIQDIGARYYTYISTMALSMEAAAENGISFVVLDRPNPINGISVEGNLLEKEFATFVGMFPVPVRHGITVGEYALMINGKKWLKNELQADLTIIKMKGWKRDMWYDETGLKWRAPSPNIPDLQVATIYPGTCLFEGTNLSEGRGTYQPFLKIGAPWFNQNTFVSINKVLDIPGALFAPISFTPKSIKSMSVYPKFEDIQIQGLQIAIKNRDILNAYLAGIELVKFLYDQQKEKFEWHERHFDRLCGTDKIRKSIVAGEPLAEIKEWCENDVESFLKQREKYLLY